jgi:HK97 family phage prohead protease
MERRMTPSGEIKVEKRADGGSTVTGYAAVFYRDGDPGTEYRLGPDVVERIAPTAFQRALQEKHDARALFNHDPNMLLGRASAGTLRLSVDQRGLRYEIDIPDTNVGKDVATSIARGDLSGSSFAFRINGKGGQRFEKGKEQDVRNILDVDLFDVGPVTYPAYEGTTTGLRSGECDDALKARDAWAAEQSHLTRERRLKVLALDNEVQMQ